MIIRPSLLGFPNNGDPTARSYVSSINKERLKIPLQLNTSALEFKSFCY